MAFIESLGRQTISIFHQLGAIILLLIAAVKEIDTIRSRETFKQCLSLGVLSFPIVALTLLFTGMVLSVQIAGELTKYGADFTVGAIVAIGVGRELGPVLCGVVLAGRVGAAITAEIGTMRVTEQIDALRCMAVSPIGYLVVPRLVACMAMLPILNVFGVVIGVGGGMIVASLSHGVSSYVFMHSIRVFCVPSDLYIGVIKSIIFGMIVALVGCDRGMTCTAGAEGVGNWTGGPIAADSPPTGDIPAGTRFLHSDVSAWPVTASLSAGVSGGTIHMPYDKATAWPAVDGLNANPWAIVNLDGQWYAATFEWLRHGQTSKPVGVLNGSKGDHFKVAPLSGWRPRGGERFGLMVSGLARSAERNVRERSNVSWVVWP